MTDHRTIILDELEEAENILENGFEKNRINKYQLTTLAKYFVSLGHKGKKLEKELISFCDNNYNEFNPILYRGLIKDVINIAEKYKSNQFLPVIIHTNELSAIQECPNKTAKVLFSMLVLAKNAQNNSIIENSGSSINYYCYYSIKEISRFVGINLTNKEIKDMKYYLDAQKAFISATEVSSKIWKVLIAESNSASIILVDDFRNILNTFPDFCEKCKKPLTEEEKSKKHNLCKECYQEKRKEDIRNNVRNHRKRYVIR